MKHSRFLNGRWWKTVAISLGLMALVGGWWLGRAGPVSWAAPGQSPHQQTVPTRPPTPTPVTPTSTPTPSSETPVSTPEKENGEDDEPAPTPLPVEPDAPPIQPQGPAPDQDQVVIETGEVGQTSASPDERMQPVASPVPRSGEVDNNSSLVPISSATLGPAESDLPEPVETEEPTLVEAEASAPPATPLPEAMRWGQSDQTGWLTWLYALLLGVVLIAIGFYLVNRA